MYLHLHKTVDTDFITFTNKEIFASLKNQKSIDLNHFLHFSLDKDLMKL